MNYEQGRKYISDIVACCKDNFSPEHYLWAMCIAQAVYDLRDENGKYREDAINFLTNSTKTLEHILHMCGFDFLTFKTNLYNIAKNEEKRRKV